MFQKVNQSRSGVLPPGVLDVLTSFYSEELHFNRQALDMVEVRADPDSRCVMCEAFCTVRPLPWHHLKDMFVSLTSIVQHVHYSASITLSR